MRTVSDGRQRGVTLIELIVVMVIISIALAMVVPNLGNTYQNWMLRSAGRRTAALFRFASDTARREGTDLAGYYENHRFILLRNGAVFRELEIAPSIVVRPEKPRAAVFLKTGLVIGPEEFVLELENDRGRRAVIKPGPLPGQVRLEESTQ